VTVAPVRAASAGCSPVLAEVSVLDGGEGPVFRTEMTLAAGEPVFAGHYPDFPIFPGVCLIECARLSAIATAAPGEGDPLRLAVVESARFKNAARPGDRLTLDLTWAERAGGRRVTARITSDRGDVASTRLLFRHDDLEAGGAVPGPAGDGPGGAVLPVDIRAVLPHRYPILLVDRVLRMVPDQSITAVKLVSGGEPWFGRAGDGEPLTYPQVLHIESWAQAAGVLTNAGSALRPDHVMLFGGAANVEFFGRVRPGDVLEHRVRVERRFPDTVMFAGESLVDGVVKMRVGSMTMAFRPSSQLTTRSVA
jgi:3-hydroxymyristoyl/3-hydroxydecanoyl-(acyl carrier protein) dehydratase